MAVNPKNNIFKLERILSAWNVLAPDGQFGGMTRQQFEVFVTASKTARIAIDTLENQLKDAITLRDLNDEIALAKAQLVKNGVLADPERGINSALYEAMGYVRQNDRKTGLTRKKNLISQPA